MSICALATRWVLILFTSPILLLALALQWTWSALTHEADWNKKRTPARHRVVIPSAICLGTRLRTGQLGYVPAMSRNPVREDWGMDPALWAWSAPPKSCLRRPEL